MKRCLGLTPMRALLAGATLIAGALAFSCGVKVEHGGGGNGGAGGTGGGPTSSTSGTGGGSPCGPPPFIGDCGPLCPGSHVECIDGSWGCPPCMSSSVSSSSSSS